MCNLILLKLSSIQTCIPASWGHVEPLTYFKGALETLGYPLTFEARHSCTLHIPCPVFSRKITVLFTSFEEFVCQSG